MPRTSRLIAEQLSRRDLFRLSAAGVVGFSLSGWLERLAASAANDPQRRRACILLWMAGGPSQMDTFDLKPGHANGGTYAETATAVPGIKISEHLPKIARHMDRMAIIRSMSTKEADHGRAMYLLRTGQLEGGPIQYPPLGSMVAKELGRDDTALPHFVSIAPQRGLSPAAFTPGFLGPLYAPLIVGEGVAEPNPQQPAADPARSLKVQDLDLPSNVTSKQAQARIEMLEAMERDFVAAHPGAAPLNHRTAYERAVRMMRSEAAKAFNVGDEPKELRERYGMSLFGQGCLLARRLVERGVPFVEVTLSNIPGVNNGLGWDTHQDNFENVKRLSQVLDAAWSTLMEDLKERGLLDSTLVVWMGEFGRTPKINPQKGRDHWATSWSTVLAGGGIKGGQVIGRTSKDGMEVEDRPVAVADFLATICLALGIDPGKQNISNGRPIRLVDKAAEPIKEILA
jgi:Protein of unknown function (DUF1501)